jgi:uncharacterized lipoprotein YmbA
MLNLYTKILLGLCAVVMSACSSTPATQFYVLQAVSQPTTEVLSNDKKPLIGVGPLTLPAVLGRTQIVSQKADNSIEIAEFHQWAAPLQESIIAVLSKNIATLQPNALIKAYPWSAYGNMDYRIIIDITRFDSQRGQSATLEASWSIMEEKKHTLIRSGQTKITKNLPDASYSSVAKVFSALLADFSQQLVLAIKQLPKPN